MSANIQTEIYIALRDHLQTYSQAPTITYPGETFDPPTDSNGLPAIFWIVQDARLPVSNLYVGNDTPDEFTGSFQVHIMAPERITHPQLMYQVGLISNHFAKSTEIWLAAGRLQVTNTPYLATDPYVDGIYRRAPVLVPWRVVG